MKSLRYIILLTVVVAYSGYADDELSVLSGLVNSDSSSSFIVPADQIIFDLAKDKKSATFQVGAWSPLRALSTAIEIKTPFDASSEVSTLGDLDSLSDSTTLSLSVNYRRIGQLQDSDLEAERSKALCKKYTPKSNLSSCSFGVVKNDIDEYVKDLSELDLLKVCERFELSEYLCHKNNANNLGEVIAEQWSKKKAKIYGPLTHAHLFPVKISIGREKFNYLNAQTYEKVKNRKEDEFLLSAGYGYLTYKFFAGINLSYKEEYKSSSMKEYCTPVGDEANGIQCEDLNFGAPSLEKRHNASLEIRYRPESQKYAYGFKYTRDFKEDEDQIQIPIYFVRSKGQGLFGGVRLDWRSETDNDDDDIKASLFLGSSFKFFD